MAAEVCGICGGDGRIANSFGSQTTCPGCHGSGRRSEDGGLRDVTKTKASHHRQPNKAPAAPERPNWPSTHAGGQRADEVKATVTLSVSTKEKLIREIVDHEAARGQCTQTFIKKVRKQLRPASA